MVFFTFRENTTTLFHEFFFRKQRILLTLQKRFVKQATAENSTTDLSGTWMIARFVNARKDGSYVRWKIVNLNHARTLQKVSNFEDQAFQSQI